MKKSSSRINLVSQPALALTILLAMASPLQAQQNNNDGSAAKSDLDPDNYDGMIIVTAQKSEQSITDVPITISAISGDDLDNIGVSELDELSNYVPGLFIQEQSANNPGIVIRGITSDSGSAQQGARVTLYYNGVDISRSRGAYQDLYDIDRIEVVKGPQATLFGTASTIGAVSILSKKPEAGFSSKMEVGYGNYDEWLVRGHVNYGGELIGLRVAGAWKKRDGYVRNIAGAPNIPNQNTAGIDQGDLYAKDQFGMRATLRITPSDDTTIDIVGTYDQQRHGGTPFISGTLPATGGSTSPYDGAELSGSPFSKEVLGLEKLGLNREVYDINATLETQFTDSIGYTQITGYRDFDSLEVFDADGSPAFYLEFAEDAKGWQFSHESRFYYNSDIFRGFVGMNYFMEEGRQTVPFSTEEGTYLQCAARLVPGLPCVAPDGTVTAEQATALITQGAANFLPYQSVFENRGKNDSFSVFADMTIIPTPALELTAGVRWLTEKRKSYYAAVQPNSVITGAPLLPALDTGGQAISDQERFDAWLPRFNALFRVTDNVNLYGTISRGRRSPIVDVPAAPADRIIPAEKVWNYEGGIKFAQNGIRANIGIFYQQYQNFQVSIQDDAGQFQTVNAGGASNFGVEADVYANVADWLTLFASGAYIDATIDDKPENGTFANNRFRLQSEWQLAGGFTINAPISDDVAFFMTPSVTWQDDMFFELPNNPQIAENGYVLVNLTAGVSFADGRYRIEGYARNLFDEQYLIDAGNTGGSFGIPTYIPGEPLFYGIRLSASY